MQERHLPYVGLCGLLNHQLLRSRSLQWPVFTTGGVHADQNIHQKDGPDTITWTKETNEFVWWANLGP